jgi:AcrR family transcriptional regulator
MLKEALVRLLEEKPLEKITVYELCAEAEINRTTFYKYYGSQYELMEDIQADFLHELEINLQEKENPHSLQNILTYIDKQRSAALILLKSAPDNGFLEKILSLSLITDQIEEYLSPEEAANRKAYTKEFVIFGSYSVVRKWLLSEQPETPEEIAIIINSLVGKVQG